MSRLLIIGAGGHGRAIAEAARFGGEHELVGFLDDGVPGAEVMGMRVHGPVSSLPLLVAMADLAIVAIGQNHVRESLQERVLEVGFRLATVVHPRAVVSPSAKIGVGSAIMAAAVVGTEAQLGLGVIINSGSVVDHHCVVEDFGHVGANASMAGGSVLGRRAWMQAGSALGYRVKIDADEVLGPCQGRA